MSWDHNKGSIRYIIIVIIIAPAMNFCITDYYAGLIALLALQVLFHYL